MMSTSVPLRYMVIGVLPDGDQLTHVLYRRHGDPDQPWSDNPEWANLPADEQVLARQLWVSGHPSVALVRRQPDGSWRLVVEHDFLSMSSLHITGVHVEGEPDPGHSSARR